MNPPNCKPGTSAENKTGSWRSYRPTVDSAKCIKCGICAGFCPEGCINIDPKTGAVIDYNYCKGCGICARECPKKAITMSLEEKK